MSGNPLEPGAQPDDRINVLVESELAYWTKELDVSRALLARVINEVGERVEDVKRRIAELSESGD
ncbi:DUF3606 domain-containing protein [Massilia sp. R2A-15]|uniref:DUF3606 domain-containing protein n=1 Tax=Massilia sp. R2A-15 TaxID=3064278 RepID=UPI002732DFD4|nr:DUF3606 domain-containing protein [Massilia sp. R2A-15]WLI87439.1 DUF3606 domain-containing protein [Massilia sp. R2A-15]